MGLWQLFVGVIWCELKGFSVRLLFYKMVCCCTFTFFFFPKVFLYNNYFLNTKSMKKNKTDENTSYVNFVFFLFLFFFFFLLFQTFWTKSQFFSFFVLVLVRSLHYPFIIIVT